MSVTRSTTRAAQAAILPDMKETPMDKKDAYVKKLQAQLDEFNAKIDVLKAKAEKAESSTRLQYYEKLEDLSLKRELAKSRLQELKNSSSDAWEDLKGGVEDAWNDFSTSIKEAMSRFK